MDATSYVLELSDWVTFSISSFTVYGSASNFTFTGLVPGRYYSISVTVNCTGGSYVSGTVYDSTSLQRPNRSREAAPSNAPQARLAGSRGFGPGRGAGGRQPFLRKRGAQQLSHE
ncbi:unnamed protein product [Lampetra planeri]